MRALLFPGQGSQKVGMGAALAATNAAARRVYEEADEVLGEKLSRVCWEGPEADLVLTANAQPAILTTSIAVLRAMETPPDFGAVAGHSLGEWSALVAAGAIRFGDAVRLTRLRGRAMQEAVPAGTGAMAALLGLAADVVDAVCAEAAEGQIVSAANLNGAGQVVIAGHKAAVERAMALARARGAKRAVPLAVSAPFHCALMAPAAERLAAALADAAVADPSVPVVHNVDGRPNRDGARVKELLIKQVTAPVRWEACVQTLASLGASEALELGAGNVLAGLVRRIAPGIAVTSMDKV
ncbi:MAG TPA: ACP S-malonyltransferase [Haliangiales bacterium]|nr:ACP S-malonyltransferase [Haliangiales bacterium]